jgi:hypothetical protein
VNNNVETASGDSQLTTDNDQSNSQNNDCFGSGCTNTADSNNVQTASGNSKVTTDNDQRINKIMTVATFSQAVVIPTRMTSTLMLITKMKSM